MVVEAEESARVLLVVTVVVAVLLLFFVGVIPEFILVLMLLLLVPAEAVFTGACVEFVVDEAGVLEGLAVGAINIELPELLAELL